MKKLTFIINIFLFFASSIIQAQQNIIVHSDGSNLFYNPISQTDSIKLNNNYSDFYISGNSQMNIPINAIDSLTFETTPLTSNKIYIIYNGNDVTIINPLASSGVSITKQNAKVIINSTATAANIEYNLLGSSSNGSLTATSSQSMVFRMNNLNLTNDTGAAINVTNVVETTISLKDYSVNNLKDNTASTINGALFTNGNFVFTGNGTLNVNAYKKHGITAAKNIEVNSGKINILSANGDAIHSEGFTMNNGALNISPVLGDGIDSGATALTINNGAITINSTENDVKAIKSDEDITIANGNH